MSAGSPHSPEEVAALISKSGLGIYDPIPVEDPKFLSLSALEELLGRRLRGLSLKFPIRTRAKVAKAAVCTAMGYPVPASFQKTRPRFPGQDLDIYVQKANNLQIWNEEVSAERRYALIRVDSGDVVVAVRVLTGEAVALLDTTGTLTGKFQARRREDGERPRSTLVTPTDTSEFVAAMSPSDEIVPRVLGAQSPSDEPAAGSVISIGGVWARLSSLVGSTIRDPGLDQERNRGAELQRHVCAALGLKDYGDVGQFPDIRSQALEVKLQTSPTIDLGLVSPDSEERVEGLGEGLRHCDMRYAVFYGKTTGGGRVLLEGLVVSTGAGFFGEFRRFGGLVVNKKLQIPLPVDLFRKAE